MADDISSTTNLGIDGLTDAAEIGVGGFATVYKAYQAAFRRTVAVKVLATHNLDQESRDRFERECQAMGSLSDHPNIVTVYGAGFTESAQSQPYLVMAYLAGGSMAERVSEGGPMAWQDATLYGVHLAGALETAHRSDVVHRDIKPANVLTSAFGDAMLTDFGIARISGGHETRSGVITASMHHAPPEVIDGQRPTVSGDVYSLASTVFELMVGRPPFEQDGDEGMVPMIRRILTDPPPDLRPLGVPEPVCRALERALAKDPTERQSSALEFGRELQAARRASGLEGGKLTVPNDASGSGEVSFVAAPSQVLCQHCHSELPVGADACASCGRPVGPAAIAPVGAPAVESWSGGAGAPISPAGRTMQVPAPVPGGSGGGAGRWVALGLVAFLVFALAVVGVLLLVGDDESPEVADPDDNGAELDTRTGGTDSLPATTEPQPAADGYTPQVERNFINTCEENRSRDFCRCVFDTVREEISFERFLEIETLAEQTGSLEGTEFADVRDECDRIFPIEPTVTG